jgi:hypothetical protein
VQPKLTFPHSQLHVVLKSVCVRLPCSSCRNRNLKTERKKTSTSQVGPSYLDISRLAPLAFQRRSCALWDVSQRLWPVPTGCHTNTCGCHNQNRLRILTTRSDNQCSRSPIRSEKSLQYILPKRLFSIGFDIHLK